MSTSRLTTAELSDRWGMSIDALEVWRSKGIGPRYMKLGKWRGARVLYRIKDIEAFEKKKMVKTHE